mgnify:CR=1 FL=1
MEPRLRTATPSLAELELDLPTSVGVELAFVTVTTAQFSIALWTIEHLGLLDRLGFRLVHGLLNHGCCNLAWLDRICRDYQDATSHFIEHHRLFTNVFDVGVLDTLLFPHDSNLFGCCLCCICEVCWFSHGDWNSRERC